MNAFSRRDFFKVSTLAGAAVAAGVASPAGSNAVEPLNRPGKPRLALGLAAYSFRQYFKDSSHKREYETEESKRMDLVQFIDYCADQGCAGAELTSYYLPQDVTPEFLLRIRKQAFLRGIAISGTAVGNNFALPAGEKRNEEIAKVKQWIDRAAIMGAPHIRIFAGAAPKGVADTEARSMCIAAVEECCDYAGGKGIFLGLENHGGIVALPEGLLEIVRAVKSPWLGINLDSGNFVTEDPYADLAKIAPYAVNVQIKVEMKKPGTKEMYPADLGRIVKILREANYQGFVTLEYEAKESPWEAVPRYLEQLRPLLT